MRNAENNLRNEICRMKVIGWRAWSRDQHDSAIYCLPSELDEVVICGTPAVTIIRQDICHTCHQDEPPARKSCPHRGPVHRVWCDFAGIIRYVLAYEIRTMVTSATSVSSYFL